MRRDAPKGALIVLGHGSRNPAAGRQFMDLIAALQTRRQEPVYAAFMELARPSLADAVSAALGDGCEEIVVQPCFLLDGNHIRRDIPEMLAELQARHPGARFRCGRPIGPDPRIVDILLERAAEARCLT